MNSLNHHSLALLPDVERDNMIETRQLLTTGTRRQRRRRNASERRRLEHGEPLTRPSAWVEKYSTPQSSRQRFEDTPSVDYDTSRYSRTIFP